MSDVALSTNLVAGSWTVPLQNESMNESLQVGKGTHQLLVSDFLDATSFVANLHKKDEQ